MEPYYGVGSLEYGLPSGPVKNFADMTADEFATNMSGWSYDYNYKAMPEMVDTQGFWDELATSTENVVDASTGFVWDTATGTWDSIKSGAMSVAGAVTDAGTSIASQVGGVFDSLLMRIVLIFAVLVAGVYIIAKTGIIKDIGAIV